MAIKRGTAFGAFEIVGPLGKGGMGEVYRARDTKLGRDVAIKVLPRELATDTDRLARFEREARVLASLNHPRIAAVYGFESTVVEDDDFSCRYLVMELVEGDTLLGRVRRGPISVEDAIPIFVQIAEGLDAAHGAGIIHRDLKPANVKITAAGDVKVLDFGLAKASKSKPDSDPNAPTAVAAGTPSSMTRKGVIAGDAGVHVARTGART